MELMYRRTALLSAAIVALALFAVAGSAAPQQEQATIYVTADDAATQAALQDRFGVRFRFGDTFSTTVPAHVVDRLEQRPGVSVEEVATLRILHHKDGHSRGGGNNGGDTGLSVSWANPGDGDAVSGDVTIQIDASDSDGNVTGVTWTVDGTTSETSYDAGSGYWEDTWDSTTVSDGDYTLTAEAADDAGNTATTSISVTVDNVADSTRSATPSDQTPYGIETMYNDSALDASSGGTGVDVAVLDTGTTRDHPDLAGQVEVCRDYSGGRIKTDACSDGNGHGTHVSGTVLADAGSDGQGIYGVAPGADLHAYKVCNNGGRCSGDAIAAAIRDAADNGAEIISMSLGGGQDSRIQDAVQYAHSQGVLIVAAAGNSGPYLESIEWPGADRLTVGVGAADKTDRNGAIAPSNYRITDFSSRGTAASTFQQQDLYIEVSAPGQGILSTWNDGGYNTISGTSMATPHVSGLAATAWGSVNDADGDGVKNDDVRGWLQDRARAFDVTRGQHTGDGYDPAAGLGIPTIQ